MDAAALYYNVDTTSLYYTFSTIAQTLAGAMAVLVAFALFGMAKLDEAIRNGIGGVGGYSRPQERWEALRSGGISGLERSLGAPVSDAGARIVFQEAVDAANLRPRVLRALGRALGATVIDIALCFIALPLAPILARRPILAWSTTGVAVAVGVVCLGLYWRLIAAMGNRPAHPLEAPGRLEL